MMPLSMLIHIHLLPYQTSYLSRSDTFNTQYFSTFFLIKGEKIFSDVYRLILQPYPFSTIMWYPVKINQMPHTSTNSCQTISSKCALLMNFLFPLYVFFPVALSNLTSPCILILDIDSTQEADYTISRTLFTVDISGSPVYTEVWEYNLTREYYLQSVYWSQIC